MMPCEQNRWNIRNKQNYGQGMHCLAFAIDIDMNIM